MPTVVHEPPPAGETWKSTWSIPGPSFPAGSDGSASFVGIERVAGTIAGKQGTFLLQDSGIVSGDTVQGDWFVIPGSGTGELTGIRGKGEFHADLGEGARVYLDYWIE